MTKADVELGLSRGELEPEVVLARSGDYLFPLCASCGGRVEVRYKGADPSFKRVQIGCPRCGTESTLKLNEDFFRDFPAHLDPHRCIPH